jgi:hypothetical protein
VAHVSFMSLGLTTPQNRESVILGKNCKVMDGIMRGDVGLFTKLTQSGISPIISESVLTLNL